MPLPIHAERRIVWVVVRSIAPGLPVGHHRSFTIKNENIVRPNAPATQKLFKSTVKHSVLRSRRKKRLVFEGFANNVVALFTTLEVLHDGDCVLNVAAICNANKHWELNANNSCFASRTNHKEDAPASHHNESYSCSISNLGVSLSSLPVPKWVRSWPKPAHWPPRRTHLYFLVPAKNTKFDRGQVPSLSRDSSCAFIDGEFTCGTTSPELILNTKMLKSLPNPKPPCCGVDHQTL